MPNSNVDIVAEAANLKLFQKIIFSLMVLLLATSCSSERPSLSETTPTVETIIKIDKLPLIIGHRGARSLAPENTIASARKALEIGADMWELDVAVTSDNELVVLHDDTLDRTCNVKDLFPGKVPWRVWEFTLAEIKTLDCGSWFIKTDPFGQIKAGAVSQEEIDSYVGEPLPSLREALEFTHDNNWRVDVELKDQTNEELSQTLVTKTVELIHELGMDDGKQVVISSFNHDYLKGVRSLNPNIPVQAITSTKINDLPEYLTEIGADACNPKLDVWNIQELVDLGKKGIHFNVWTVNDESTMRELIDAKVQGIITDYPQVLILVMNK
jgi:glycerophosphoryl diester phosphodiesterase